MPRDMVVRFHKMLAILYCATHLPRSQAERASFSAHANLPASATLTHTECNHVLVTTLSELDLETKNEWGRRVDSTLPAAL